MIVLVLAGAVLCTVFGFGVAAAFCANPRDPWECGVCGSTYPNQHAFLESDCAKEAAKCR